jgi:hypothetical protein
MGLDIFRCKGFDHMTRGYDLAECLEKHGAYFDSEPVLRVPKQALVNAMKDEEYGEAISEAFRVRLPLAA